MRARIDSPKTAIDVYCTYVICGAIAIGTVAHSAPDPPCNLSGTPATPYVRYYSVCDQPTAPYSLRNCCSDRFHLAKPAGAFTPQRAHAPKVSASFHATHSLNLSGLRT